MRHTWGALVTGFQTCPLPIYDLDEAVEATGAFTECQREPGRYDDDDGDDLRDRTLDRFQHLLELLLPGHARSRRLRGGGDREGQADGGAYEEGRTAGWNLEIGRASGRERGGQYG